MKKIKIFSLFAAMLFAGSTMAADVTLFTTNFSTADGWSTESIITSAQTTNTKLIKGTAISFKGYKSSDLKVTVGETETADGTLTFTGNNLSASAGDASSANYYMAIPVSGVNGSLTVTTTGDATKWYYTYDDGDKGTIAARLQASANYTFTITGLTNSNVTVYIGNNGKSIKSITFTTPQTITGPWLNFSEETVELNVTPNTSTAESTITLKGGNLTAGTYSFSVPNVEGLTVEPASVTVAEDGTINQDVTLTYTSAVDVLENTTQLSVTINNILAQLNITYSAALTVDANTIFHWQMSGTSAPSAGTALSATGGSIMPATDGSSTTLFSTESAAYVEGTPNEMKATDGKGVKFGTNALSFKVALADNATFKSGDIVSICGYLPWKISSTSEHNGDLAASVATGTDKNNYAVGQVVLTADADTLYLMRAQGSSTAIAAIKVERPTECADAEVALPANPDIEVEENTTTITAPTLTNPKNLVIRYVSSDAEIVAIDESEGFLTKGKKTGTATITISWVRQTVNSVRYCAGELTYTVTVKSGATAVENTAVAAPAVKVIRDGQLLIIREGKTYTAQGVQLQ
ncbi:MAG: hypothetical protein ACI4TV_06145 [Paludibacteraceae bacterium]